MSKVAIVGNAAVITSEVSFKELQMIEKYRPEALCLKDDKGQDYFCIGTTSLPGDNGSINKYGASFAKSGEDKATVTIIKDDGIPNLKNWIVEELGGSLQNLGEVEASLADIAKEITEAREALMNSITEA